MKMSSLRTLLLFSTTLAYLVSGLDAAGKPPSNPEPNPQGSPGILDSPQPVLVNPDPAKTWILDERFSDEFNTAAVDEEKWEKDLRPWGERAWSSDNVFQRNGSLVIRAHYEPHLARGQQYFYKLGVLRSREKATYGYFEARIKGCSRFPGLCPAFWLYSHGKDNNLKYPKVTYSEIDIVELQQGLYVKDLKREICW